jgi:hypothetical protein
MENKVCKFFLNGNCKHGDNCKFLHEKKENINNKNINNKNNINKNIRRKHPKNTENFNPSFKYKNRLVTLECVFP